MALFSRTKDKKVEAPEENATSAGVAKRTNAKPTDRNVAMVLVKPRITEKSVGQGERNVYTFVVHQNATKQQVKEAVKTYFNVTPVRVNIVNKIARTVMSRSKGRRISEPGRKKAYVYLKKGETITLV